MRNRSAFKIDPPLVCSVLSVVVVPVVHRFSTRAASVRSETDVAARAEPVDPPVREVAVGRTGRMSTDERHSGMGSVATEALGRFGGLQFREVEIANGAQSIRRRAILEIIG